MPGKIIIPINELNDDKELIFLMGPIVGAPFWHNEAIETIQRLDDQIHIACPTPHERIDEKYSRDNPLKIKDFTRYADDWPEVEWQLKYINRAREHGCILAWLPRQVDLDTGYDYARTTRNELGWQMFLQGNLVIGNEHAFQGGDYIRYLFKKYRPETVICNTLEQSCRESIRLAREC